MKDLNEVPGILKKYGVKLNSKKCVLEVATRKFLGFIVSQRGIEANPKKIKVIKEMQAPCIIKTIWRLIRRIAALSHFMSRLLDKYFPFFKLLRKIKNFEWTKECQGDFKKLKKCLSSPPFLAHLSKVMSYSISSYLECYS